MTKAIALLSGGLDSILAVKLIQEQGIEVESVNFLTIFCTCTSKNDTCLASQSAAKKLNVPLKVFEVSDEYIELVKTPRHGYGSNMNPCIDCRIFILKKSAAYMREVGASFLFTGEVLDERPMSQRRRALEIIDKESGLSGLILRPLSAKLLEPTLPEKGGLVDRNRLLDIRGRSRKPQIKLAKELGVNDYPCPSGGCLLTDPGFAKRMKDLMKFSPDFNKNDAMLLKLGRHFRLSSEAKLIVGRNEQENERLTKLAKDTDIWFNPTDVKGPTAIGRGIFDDEKLATAARIVARYSDVDLHKTIEIVYKKLSCAESKRVMVFSMSDNEVKTLRI